MIERVILENLLHNEDYLRRVLPFLKDEYFAEGGEVLVFKKIHDFTVKYNKTPTQDELLIELKDTVGISQGAFDQANDLVKELDKRSKAPSIDWLIEHTEKFCKDKALYNAISEAAMAIDNQDADLGKLPDLLMD
jgi:replicative DNA helicase